MRIALIGAPGAGKTDLAQKLAESLGLYIIDDYVPDLEGRTNIAMGYLADFVPNIMCATERLACESEVAKHSEVGYVLCGTIVESACYASLKAVHTMEYASNRNIEIVRVNAVMDTLTMILTDTWVYDHAFYLPLPASHEDDWDRRLDYSIRDCLAMLSIDHTPLTGEDQFNAVLEAIKQREESDRRNERDAEGTNGSERPDESDGGGEGVHPSGVDHERGSSPDGAGGEVR